VDQKLNAGNSWSGQGVKKKSLPYQESLPKQPAPKPTILLTELSQPVT
jgi:hypothetical protein